MAQKVPHLTENRGAYTYERRVPAPAQQIVGLTKWRIGLGTDYVDAAVEARRLKAEHDEIISGLKDPAKSTVTGREMARREAAAIRSNLVHPGEHMLAIIGEQRGGALSFRAAGPDMVEIDLDDEDVLGAIRAGIRAADQAATDGERLVAFRRLLAGFWGDHMRPFDDPDDRDEHDMLRRRIERRLADLEDSPDRISAVMERALVARQITPQVANRYRRNLRAFTDFLQTDPPIGHITPKQLRDYRDTMTGRLKVSSIASNFTTLKSAFAFAIEEEIIDVNPMQSVKLPTEKRSKDEIKWLPYTPEEMQRIMAGLRDHFGKPMTHLSEERRHLVVWGITTLAYSALRPIEFARLKPGDVTDDYIRVRRSKTKSSTRVVPLHPQLMGLREFIDGGGLKTLDALTKDKTIPLRHNFVRLIRETLDPPILDDRKGLYSLRSTFSNAMRRAGATPDIRRAILGHREAGALGSYDDGPEMEIKRRWVHASDPLRDYSDAGPDDHLGSSD